MVHKRNLTTSTVRFASERAFFFKEPKIYLNFNPYIPKENLSDVLGDENAPLLAIEIISLGQTIGDMVKKCEGMIASGVEECWIVEPANESITVCTKGRRFVRHEGEVLNNRFLREPLRVEAIFHEEIQ